MNFALALYAVRIYIFNAFFVALSLIFTCVFFYALLVNLDYFLVVSIGLDQKISTENCNNVSVREWNVIGAVEHDLIVLETLLLEKKKIIEFSSASQEID